MWCFACMSLCQFLRYVAMSHLVWRGSLTDDCSGNAAAAGELRDRIAAILAAPGLWKKLMSSRSPVVRRASYSAISKLCSRWTFLHQQLHRSSLSATEGTLIQLIAATHCNNGLAVRMNGLPECYQRYRHCFNGSITVSSNIWHH
jgi:hypothetical protein